jgi:hypothetical protein
MRYEEAQIIAMICQGRLLTAFWTDDRHSWDWIEPCIFRNHPDGPGGASRLSLTEASPPLVRSLTSWHRLAKSSPSDSR